MKTKNQFYQKVNDETIHYIFFSLFAFFFFLPSCIITKPTIVIRKKTELVIDTGKIYRDVVSLTKVNQPRNNRNVASLNLTYSYIRNEFSKLDCKIDSQKYKANHREFKNLIATFNEKGKERIIIGAHYDVCENTPGADDNASGIAGILGLARLIDSLKPSLKYRIDIIAFSTEEPPYDGIPMGSWIHAKSLTQDSVQIKLAIILDMIGYYSSKKKSQDFPYPFLRLLYPNKADYALVVSKFGQGSYSRQLKKIIKQVCVLRIRSANIPDRSRSIYSSDHGSYWVFGFKALLITDTSLYRNDNYHEVSDTPETLNYKYIGEIIKGLYWYLL